MLETSARLLRLLSLFQARRYWGGAELADRLEVTTRTLRRDVDKLRSLGYPIQSTSGVEGGYQLGAGSTMPPLLFDDDEAVAAVLGLRSAAAGAVEGIGEAALRALSKIEQMLPARLRQRVTALHAMIVTPVNRASAVEARTLAAIAGACRDRESLRFRYRDYGGKASARSVEPHRLVHTGLRWYLVAWDTDRADWRTFRVDRIQGQLTADRRFQPREPPAEDLAAYVFRGMSYAPPCRARIRLLVPAETMVERLPPWVGVLERIDEASCFLETSAPTFASLAMHLALIGVDFEVTEPAELVEEVRRLGERFRRAADAATAPPPGA